MSENGMSPVQRLIIDRTKSSLNRVNLTIRNLPLKWPTSQKMKKIARDFCLIAQLFKTILNLQNMRQIITIRIIFGSYNQGILKKTLVFRKE